MGKVDAKLSMSCRVIWGRRKRMCNLDQKVKYKTKMLTNIKRTGKRTVSHPQGVFEVLTWIVGHPLAIFRTNPASMSAICFVKCL